jgi:hypothetical protein
LKLCCWINGLNVVSDLVGIVKGQTNTKLELTILIHVYVACTSLNDSVRSNEPEILI